MPCMMLPTRYANSSSSGRAKRNAIAPRDALRHLRGSFPVLSRAFLLSARWRHHAQVCQCPGSKRVNFTSAPFASLFRTELEISESARAAIPKCANSSRARLAREGQPIASRGRTVERCHRTLSVLLPPLARFLVFSFSPFSSFLRSLRSPGVCRVVLGITALS